MDVDVAGLTEYKSDALRSVTFTLVVSERELDEPDVCDGRCTFTPSLAHQIFGEREVIFGYKDLVINLLYHHNSSKCLLDIKYDSKVTGLDADDIPKIMNDWLPRNYFTNKEEFRKMLQNEKNDKMFGTIIHQFERYSNVFLLDESESVKCTYTVTQIDINDVLFQEYHERFETFIIWFIDAANFIDLKDQRWIIFYIYEEFTSPISGKRVVTPIGFTAIYKFFSYPDSNRARISQFFILPTHQGDGLGTIFYNAVYKKILNDMPEITDLTVEEPNDLFQRLRDYCDSLHIYNDLKETGGKIALMNNKVLYKYFSKHKISKKQTLRISDILRYLNATLTGDDAETEFNRMLYSRIRQQKMNENNLGKIARGSNTERVIIEDVDEDELHQELESYINQLKPVVEKLIKTIKAQ